MCYKDELQKANAEKLQKRFDDENIPIFIQRCFFDIRSKAGAINYWIAVRDLLLWLMENKRIHKRSISDITPNDFQEIDAVDITLYLEEKERGGLSPTTLGVRKQILKKFWKYLIGICKCPVTNNIVADSSYRGISSNNNLFSKLPTDQQIADMEEKIRKKPDEFVRTRNLMVVRTLKGSGIRESELAGLDFADLFLEDEMPYIMVLGKRKYREIEKRKVFLTGDAVEAIKLWLGVRNTIENIIDTEAVFLNKNGKRLNEDNIKKIFRNYGDGITPHMLRHWYATVIAKSANIVFAQQQLGHSSASITMNNYANGSYGMKDVLASM